MIPLADLHPDDLASRIALRDLLIERRHEVGLSQSRLARRIGLSQSAVGKAETGTNWHLLVLQRIARSIDARIVLYPDNLPGVGKVHDDTTAVFRPTDPQRADLWDQANLLANLVAARQALGLTQAQMGERLGSSESAVGNYERTKTGLMLISPQRYCRALGGELAMELEHLAALAVAA